MNIQLNNISKRFKRQWVIRDLSCQFIDGNSYAITGNNGSGKSTLLKMISGGLEPNKGSITWEGEPYEKINHKSFNKIGFCSPYIALFEWMTLEAYLKFHFGFVAPVNQISIQEIIQLLELDNHLNKTLENFSSGMQQRVKLATVLLSSYEVLLLDEPTSNLDVKSIDWFKRMITSFLGGRTLIIASNEERDVELCNESVNLN